jgi:hypothetical protein
MELIKGRYLVRVIGRPVAVAGSTAIIRLFREAVGEIHRLKASYSWLSRPPIMRVFYRGYDKYDKYSAIYLSINIMLG